MTAWHSAEVCGLLLNQLLKEVVYLALLLHISQIATNVCLLVEPPVSSARHVHFAPTKFSQNVVCITPSNNSLIRPLLRTAHLLYYRCVLQFSMYVLTSVCVWGGGEVGHQIRPMLSRVVPVVFQSVQIGIPIILSELKNNCIKFRPKPCTLMLVSRVQVLLE